MSTDRRNFRKALTLLPLAATANAGVSATTASNCQFDGKLIGTD